MTTDGQQPEAPLLPCPFCGSLETFKGKVTHGHGDFGETIVCRICRVEMPDEYVGVTAAQKWNHRVP